jgi:hypothetical protein
MLAGVAQRPFDGITWMMRSSSSSLMRAGREVIDIGAV